MIDVIFSTKDPAAFHKENMERNAAHYSFLRSAGLPVIRRVQECSAGVYFHPEVPFPGVC